MFFVILDWFDIFLNDIKLTLELIYSEILLDAMSSVLSYNDLDLEPVLEEGIKGRSFMAKDGPLHDEPTFMKQFLYFLLITMMNVGYDFVNSSSNIVKTCSQVVSVNSPEFL